MSCCLSCQSCLQEQKAVMWMHLRREKSRNIACCRQVCGGIVGCALRHYLGQGGAVDSLDFPSQSYFQAVLGIPLKAGKAYALSLVPVRPEIRPDSDQIPTRFRPDPDQIPRPDPDQIPTRSRPDPDQIPTRSRPIPPGSWSGSGRDLVGIWSGSGRDLVGIWSESGRNLVGFWSDWHQRQGICLPSL